MTHFAVVCDGTNTNVFVNGKLSIQKPGLDNVFSRYQIGCNRGTDKRFEGWIDDVRLYNKALNQSEIQAATGLPLENFPVLVKLRDGNGGFQYKQVASLTGTDIRFLDSAGMN